LNAHQTEASELEAIIRFWRDTYSFSFDPARFPDQPYAAQRIGRQRTIRAASPALLLDAIKDDDARARPPGPRREA
jgi:hypothetical protein